MKLRIYIDTSVIGGCFDEEFKTASRKLVQRFKDGEMIVVISELTKLELQPAPKEVQDILDEIPDYCLENHELTEEATKLAEKYISEGVVGKSKLVDAEHIAIASINRVDVLVSWNFQHIVNLDKIRGYNSVNLKYGYPLIDIRTPQEVITYED